MRLAMILLAACGSSASAPPDASPDTQQEPPDASPDTQQECPSFRDGQGRLRDCFGGLLGACHVAPSDAGPITRGRKPESLCAH